MGRIPEIERQIRETVAEALSVKKGSFTDQGAALALDLLRRIPWKPHPEGGYVVRYSADGAQVEDRWDGVSLSIRRSVTLPPAMESVALSVTIDEG